MSLALLLVVLSAEPVYSPSARAAHLQAAVEALQKTAPAVLVEAHQYIAVYERGSCSSSSERLRVECMMTGARRFCEKRPKAERAACTLFVDVVTSNLLAEKRLVPTEKRYELMKRARDWRREVNREVRRIQGELAVDFRLRMGEPSTPAELARQIDAYCLSTGDASGLSWQVCSASLAWFIGAGAPEVK